jgi:cytochrome b
MRNPQIKPMSRLPTVMVWDLFVRVFHWTLVGLFVFCFATGDVLEHPHEWAGYAITGLVGSRVVWGLIGPRHARFSDFIFRPAVILGFLFDSLRFRARRYLGHNPAGGAMVLALLLSLAVICATGVMMGLDAFWGEAWVEDLHVAASWGAVALIVLHIGGVLLASIEHRENLVRAMLTGRKRAEVTMRPDDG